jgi:hypothetical protein
MRLFSGMMIQLVVLWAIWTLASYQVATRFLGMTVRSDRLLRALAFAQAPVLLLVLQLIPVSIVGVVLRLIVGVWLLGTGYIAIRQSLDVDSNRAATVTVVGFLAAVIVLGVLNVLDVGGILRF